MPCTCRVDATTIAWRHNLTDGGSSSRSFHLHHSRDAKLSITGRGVEGADETPLELIPAGLLQGDALDRFPFLRGCSALMLPMDKLSAQAGGSSSSSSSSSSSAANANHIK